MGVNSLYVNYVYFNGLEKSGFLYYLKKILSKLY